MKPRHGVHGPAPAQGHGCLLSGLHVFSSQIIFAVVLKGRQLPLTAQELLAAQALADEANNLVSSRAPSPAHTSPLVGTTPAASTRLPSGALHPQPCSTTNTSHGGGIGVANEPQPGLLVQGHGSQQSLEAAGEGTAVAALAQELAGAAATAAAAAARERERQRARQVAAHLIVEERLPAAIRRLLEGCWATDPMARLDAEEVARKLRALSKRLDLGIPLH